MGCRFTREMSSCYYTHFRIKTSLLKSRRFFLNRAQRQKRASKMQSAGGLKDVHFIAPQRGFQLCREYAHFECVVKTCLYISTFDPTQVKTHFFNFFRHRDARQSDNTVNSY